MKSLCMFSMGLLALFAFSVYASGLPQDLQDDLHDSGHGIIQNYQGMQKGDDIDWLWVAPGTKLSACRYQVVSVKNLTVIVDHDLKQVLKDTLTEELNRGGSSDANAPLLTVDVGIYSIKRGNSAKGWIPIVGGLMAQAGVGVELVFKDASGHVVTKIRHSAREGSEPKDAGQEVADDVAEFVQSH